MWADRVLTKKEVFYFFLVASMFYVFPIIHADFRYIDDNWRSRRTAEKLGARVTRNFIVYRTDFRPPAGDR